MKTPGIPLNTDLIRELRAMALSGAETQAIVAHIRANLGLQTEAIVPILAYLGHAFPVSLRVLLPMREEGFDGQYARALQVAFWLFACVNEKLGGKPGNVNFSSWTPTVWRETDATSLEYRVITSAATQSSREFRGRGTFRERLDKRESCGPSNAEIRQRIMKFASDLATMLDQACLNHEELEKNHVSWSFDVTVQEEGPAYSVICVVGLIKDLSMQNQLPPLQPIA